MFKSLDDIKLETH